MATGARASDVLRSDFVEMRELFARFAAARAAGQTELASEICRELLESARIEEEILYPREIDLDAAWQDELNDDSEELGFFDEGDPDDITHDL